MKATKLKGQITGREFKNNPRITLTFWFMFTIRQQTCGKAMFSVMSVCLSFQSAGRSRVTITHDALDLTVKDPQTWHLTVQGPSLDKGPQCTGTPLLVTSGGHPS